YGQRRWYEADVPVGGVRVRRSAEQRSLLMRTSPHWSTRHALLAASLVAAAVLVPVRADAVIHTYTNDTPQPIPDSDEPCSVELPLPIHGEITSTIHVPNHLAVQGLAVELQIAHDFVGDLVVELTSPAGTTITLVDRPGLATPGSHDCGTRGPDLRTVLRGGADVAVHGYQPGDDATRPEMPLSSFVGQDAGGFWTLTVRDESFAAGG